MSATFQIRATKDGRYEDVNGGEWWPCGDAEPNIILRERIDRYIHAEMLTQIEQYGDVRDEVALADAALRAIGVARISEKLAHRCCECDSDVIEPGDLEKELS